MPAPTLIPPAAWDVWRRREVLDTFVFPVRGPGPSPDPARRLEDATERVLTQMRRDYPQDLTERKHGLLVARLANPADHTLIIRDEEGEACGYCHLTYGDTVNERINLRLRVRPHQAYFWDDHLFMVHRRRGLHAYSIARRLELIAKDDRTQGLTMISRGNVASRASYAAFGARRTRQHVYLKKLRRTVTLPAVVEIPAP